MKSKWTRTRALFVRLRDDELKLIRGAADAVQARAATFVRLVALDAARRRLSRKTRKG